MAYQKLQFKPGIDRESTSYAREGGWYNSDKVRFKAGSPEKIGGWEKYVTSTVEGKPRASHVWRTLDGTIYLATVTHSKAYVETGGTLYDVTPLRADDAALGSDPFATTSGSTTITVTHASHGAEDGDYVTFSSATATGGVPASELNANHEITYVNANSYTITVTTSASSSASGGGASVTGDYEISIGNADEIYGYGWGAATYGSSTWGTARTSSTVKLPPRTWSMANWGEDLLINPFGGSIYSWDATNPANRAVIVSNAPTKANTILTTKERHLVVLGCNTPGTPSSSLDTMQVRWCHQEDNTSWTATITNTAGSQRLTGGTEIISAANIEGQAIIWTDDDVHSMQYLGTPYTFGFQQIGTSTGIVGPHAWVAYNNVVYWMGQNAFYIYKGGVSPFQCTVQKFVFDGLTESQQRKVFAGLNREFNEVVWFYPTNSVEDTELNGAITASDTTLVVDTTAGFPTSGTVLVDAEKISYTSKDDTQLFGCTRGVAGGGAAATHATEATVSCTTSTEALEPSRYVSTNVHDGSWWVGRLERCTWADKGALKYPVAASQYGQLYSHEKGYDADSKALVAHIESSDFDIGEGDSMMFVSRIIPDFTISGGSVTLSLKTRAYSHSTQVTEAVGTVSSTTEKIDTRIRGRQASLRVKNTDAGDWWRYGAPRIDLRSDGRR